MKKSIAVIFLSLPVFTGYSQQKAQDSLRVNPLQEIVVTGQIEPQSLRKSVQCSGDFESGHQKFSSE